MTQTTAVDGATYQDEQRTLALRDGRDHLSRAAWAMLVAAAGERDQVRASVLIDANRRLRATLKELQGLDA